MTPISPSIRVLFVSENFDFRLVLQVSLNKSRNFIDQNKRSFFMKKSILWSISDFSPKWRNIAFCRIRSESTQVSQALKPAFEI